MKRFSAILWALISLQVMAQQPVFKIDFNEPSRSNMEEVLEPGYTPWPLRKDCVSDSLSVDGVRFIVTSKNGGTMRVGWSKAFVQTKENNARLTGDGVNFDPGITGSIELAIAGLPVGDHTIQTFHNSWKDSTVTSAYPMSVWLNGKLAEEHVNRTFMETVSSDASIVQLSFHVATAQDTIRIEFVTYDSVPPAVIKSKQEYSPLFNGFEMNTVTAKALAKRPVPADADMHVDADSGSVLLTWSPASSDVVKHYLYIGCDSVAVASADTFSTVFVGEKTYADTTYLLGSVYNLNTYYWRVDEMDTKGSMTPGTVWSFRPRHLAFRGAEGYGRFATGGREGKVVYVTNLNDSGEGSFREAITNDIGPRTIIFNVSGIIVLNSRLVCSSKYVTIAGQTAPGKGICLRNNPFGVGSENVCRFIRSRKGAGETSDGLGMTGSNHSITDHCSVSWTIDEAFSSRGADNITLQRSMIAEALNCAGHKNYPEGAEHGYAATISGEIGSFHHNLLAHCNGRNWSIGDAIDGGGQWVSQLDIFNNVVYNWGSRATDGEVHQLNFVNNYYKMGAASTKTTILKIDVLGFGWGTEQGYYSGNIIQRADGSYFNDGTSNVIGREYTIGTGVATPSYDVYVNEPFFPSYATIETARDAYKSVLSDVGCTLPMFDEHDQRIIRETLSGTYTYKGSKTGKLGLIDNEADCGGYDNYPELTRAADFDSDMDGLPDWWENLYGSDPNSAKGDFSDSNADPDRDGYTVLDDYLEWMANPHYEAQKNTLKAIDLAQYTAGYTKTPTYQAVCADGTVSFEGSIASFMPQKDFKGVTYMDFTVTDAEGASMTRRIGLLVQDSISDALPFATTVESVQVYPTLFNQSLNVRLSVVENAHVALVLRDLTGREISREQYEVSAGTASSLQMDCPQCMPAQMYLLEVINLDYGYKYASKCVIKNNR